MGKMYVIGGCNVIYLNDVWSSTDGATWTLVTAAASFAGRYGPTSFVDAWGKMYVIGGVDQKSVYLNDVWSSTDGVIWTLVTSAASFVGRVDHTSLVYAGNMYVIGGRGSNFGLFNDVWRLYTTTAMPSFVPSISPSSPGKFQL